MPKNNAAIVAEENIEPQAEYCRLPYSKKMIELGCCAEAAAQSLIGTCLATLPETKKNAYAALSDLPENLDDLPEHPRIIFDLLRKAGRQVEAADLAEMVLRAYKDASERKLVSYIIEAKEVSGYAPEQAVKAIKKFLRYIEIERQAHRLNLAVEAGRYHDACQIYRSLGPWIFRAAETEDKAV